MHKKKCLSVLIAALAVPTLGVAAAPTTKINGVAYAPSSTALSPEHLLRVKRIFLFRASTIGGGRRGG